MIQEVQYITIQKKKYFQIGKIKHAEKKLDAV